MTSTGSSALIAAIEDTWTTIQQHHPDVPDVIVTLGAGTRRDGIKLGHFATNRWTTGRDRIHELFIGGEGLARGATPVLGTLLHEATHGTATTRSIHDTSRQGRYHNTQFRTLATELGLTLEHDTTLGWSTTTVPETTLYRYRRPLAALRGALTAYRLLDPPTPTAASSNGIRAVCLCGRTLRMSHRNYIAGPILCVLCGTCFLRIPTP